VIDVCCLDQFYRAVFQEDLWPARSLALETSEAIPKEHIA
jgi:hypothetical protein